MSRTLLVMPLPSGDHAAPSQLAMQRAPTPPAMLKVPPAYSRGPVPRSTDSSTATDLLMPSPRLSSECHAPSQAAIVVVATPPAVAKLPPARSLGPAPSSNDESMNTLGMELVLESARPDPSADHVLPFHAAILLACSEPIDW